MSRGRKKKKARGTSPKRKAWIAFLGGDGVAPGLVDDDVQAARDLITGDTDEVPGVGGEVAEALASVLAEQGRSEALVHCAEQGGRELAKASRRALHALKRSGAEVPELGRSTPRPTSTDDAHGDARAVMSAPFGDGDRGLIFRYRSTSNRVLHSGMAMISDLAGIRDLKLYRGGAKTYRAMVDSARRSLTIAPIPFGFALHLVAESARETESRGRLVPDQYRALRHHLGEQWPEAGAHPGDVLKPGALPDAEGQFELWKSPEIRSWLASSEPMDELGAGIQEVLASAIMLNEQQRLERLEEVLDRVIAKVFAIETQARWSARLLDAAWVASENRRPEVAAHLLAVRQALDTSETPEQLPFCRQLLTRPLLGRLPEPFASGLIPGLPAKPEAQEAPEPEAPSLLWTPDSDPEPGPQDGGGLIIPGR